LSQICSLDAARATLFRQSGKYREETFHLQVAL